MKCALFLNDRKGAPILQLRASWNEMLLIRKNPLFILNPRLDILDCVRGFNLESDCLTRQYLDEDLHAVTKTEEEMKCSFLLNLMIRQSTIMLQLLSCED